MKRFLFLPGFFGSLLVFMAAGVFMASVARADLYADAGAYIDHDYINFSFSGSGHPTNTRLLATADIAGQSAVQDSVNAELESSEGAFYAFGETDINDPYTDYQDISAFASIESIDGENPYGYSQAGAGYSGQFQAQSAGSLTLSIDYYLYSAVQAGENQSVTSTASVLLDIGGEKTMDALSFTAVDDQFFIEETDWKTLTLTLDLAAGETVDFSVEALADTTASPVPLPGAAILMGSGLVAGVLGIRRKRRA